MSKSARASIALARLPGCDQLRFHIPAPMALPGLQKTLLAVLVLAVAARIAGKCLVSRVSVWDSYEYYTHNLHFCIHKCCYKRLFPINVSCVRFGTGISHKRGASGSIHTCHRNVSGPPLRAPCSSRVSRRLSFKERPARQPRCRARISCYLLLCETAFFSGAKVDSPASSFRTAPKSLYRS